MLGRARYLLRRLWESPPRFLAAKASIELRKRLGRGRVLRAARTGARLSEGYEDGVDSVRRLAAAVRADVLRELGSLGPSADSLVGLLAADFDAGRARCLGYGDHALAAGTWSEDAFHGHTWPRAYFADIDYVAAQTRCDVKVPWEKSRLQWLPRAGLAACLDGDQASRDRRVRAAGDLLESWWSDNPCGVGVNWVSAMEVAIRAVNLLVGLCFLEEHLERDQVSAILTSAGEHRYYLRRFPETSDVPGNHYLATELGRLFLDEFREPGGGSGASATRFVEACEGQFTQDGLHVEFAPLYHRLSLEMVVTGRALLRRTRPALAAGLDPLVDHARRACRLLANAGGELPLFGDSDSGAVLDLGQPSRRFGALADTPLSATGSQAPEQALAAVLAGIGGAAESRTVAGTAGPGPRDVAWTALAPYWVGERGGAVLVVRAGELGLAGRASHDHDDNLSFWYSVGGRDLIVEVGCPPYSRDPAERARAIGSRAHNLLSSAGEDRFQGALGSVVLTARGAPRGRAWLDGSGAAARLRAELLPGDAPAAPGCPTSHERSFGWDASGALLVCDRVAFAGPREFALRLHLAPDVPLDELRLDAAGPAASAGDLALTFALEGCSGPLLELEPYEFHPEYGASRPAPCLVLRGRTAGELTVETTVSAGAAEPA